ncbi:MAG: NAD-dependent protein deacylase [Clostridiaceae bacterium]|jgi:NAD-dependent deacetylase|nr:NAD-dependent protein deacylase [Clostridiaceae bacterium]
MGGITKFRQWIQESRRIVFFGGAGVSTESGIPDFRSVDGLYSQKYKYAPETILSHSFFMSKQAEFYEFYRDKMIFLDARPNITHIKLAQLEAEGRISAIITQNIDGLHQAAGSKKVLELHGSVHRNFCMSCGRAYGMDKVMDASGVPVCDCGGVVKPDVVLYEEGLDQDVLQDAVRRIGEADMLIVGGTSLSVYPAAGLVRYYKGNRLVLVNKSPTPYDKYADLLLQCGLGEVFGNI